MVACAAMSAAPRVALCVLLAALPAAAAAGAASERPPANGAPAVRGRAGTAHVVVETIAIDRRGTWSVGIDEADLRSGTEGVLEKSATLLGRQDSESREMVRVDVRVTPVLQADGTCSLRFESEVASVAGGARGAARDTTRPERRNVALKIGADQERMVEIFASSRTQARLALKIRCAEALVDKAPDTRFASFLLSVLRGGEDGRLEPLKSNGMRAALGREAGNLFSFNVPLEETAASGRRYRRERIEVHVTPVLIQDGRLQLDLQVTGELATVSALQPTVSHPIDRRETADLPSGGAHTVDIDVDSAGSHEGWSKVRYRLTLVVTF